MRLASEIVFILLALVWGSSFILMKIASASFGAAGVGLGRLIGGAAVLGLISLVWRPAGGGVPRRCWGWLLLISLLGYALPFVTMPWLIARTQSSGFIGMMVIFVPLMTAVIAVPVLGERPTTREALGVLGGLACLSLIWLDGLERRIAPALLGLALCVPLGYSFCNTLVRRWFGAVSPPLLAGSAMGLGALMVLPVGAPQVQLDGSTNLWAAGLALGFLAVFGTGLAIASFYWLIQREGPLKAGMVTYLVPIVAVFWSWVGREPVTRMQLAALGATVVMVWLVRRSHPAACASSDPAAEANPQA